MRKRQERRLCEAGCGKRVNTAVAKYCSNACQHGSEYRARVMLLEKGEYPPTPHPSGFLRKYLIRTIGEACSKCGWEERHPSTGRIIVEIEHIDGDWKNNRPE